MFDALEEGSLGDYVDGDSSAVVCGALTDEDIIMQVTGKDPIADEDDKDK